MSKKARRWVSFLIVVGVLAGSLMWLGAKPAPKENTAAALTAKVKQGDFKVVITAAGELRARKFTEIRAPGGGQMDRFGMYQTQIVSMVPEGTIVKKGDFVAELDRTSLGPRIQEAQTALEKAQLQVVQAGLDTALAMATAREEIHNLETTLEEKRIAKEQAVYEAPSVRRQAEVDYEKTQRQLEQAKLNFVTKENQNKAKYNDVVAEVARQGANLVKTQGLLDQFTIRAPADGMVVYARDFAGRKKAIGTQVNPWEGTVATLPDLKEMESFTYVNEIDVGKVKVGQTVRITLDGDPSKRLTGKVTSIANIGEQRPNSDAKVFEVDIQLEGYDAMLRPGMTTANQIEIGTYPASLSVPIEAVMTDGEEPIVYVKRGGVARQRVRLGASNENEIVILKGVKAGEQVLLAEPANAADLELVKLR